MAISDEEKNAERIMQASNVATPRAVITSPERGIPNSSNPSPDAWSDTATATECSDKPIDTPRYRPDELTLVSSRDRLGGIRPWRSAYGTIVRRPGMSADPDVTLYRLQACPFCERVVRRLEEYDLDYRSRFVEPIHSDRNVVKRISGKRTVPAIVDEHTGVTMSESANIVEYLDRTYGDGVEA
jgi:glutaredoxin